MNPSFRPNPVHVPTLTEVIELQVPTPVGEQGMNSAPRPEAPAQGAPGSVPIITSGLASSQAPSNWTPMTTVVVPSTLTHEATLSPASAVGVIPVLDAVVPELTEPVEVAASFSALAPVAAPVHVAPVAAPAAAPEITEAQLAQRVLGVVQKQIDSMIDFRLKEAMVPILARHTEALVRDLRDELSRTMGDVVARSVAQEMAKLRQR